MDEKKSIYLKTADFIDDDVLFETAMCKLNGIGVRKDEEEAFELLKILAGRGFAPAMRKLAGEYDRRGDGASADKWRDLGASHGDVGAKIDLYMQNRVRKTEVRNDPIEITKSDGGFTGLIQKALPHVVKVAAPCDEPNSISTGSGFILDGGYIVTNEHVVCDGPDDVAVAFEPSVDRKVYSVERLIVCPDYDLAVYRFKGLMRDKMERTEHLKLRTGDVEFGEQLYTIGAPMGLGLSICHGIASNPHCVTSYRKLPYVVQSDMSINSGNSGGGLLDMNNRVTVVTTYTLKGGEGGLSLCVPAKCVVEVLNSISNR